jgi:hypothetical protein
LSKSQTEETGREKEFSFGKKLSNYLRIYKHQLPSERGKKMCNKLMIGNNVNMITD